jgi:hypothetical protein
MGSGSIANPAIKREKSRTTPVLKLQSVFLTDDRTGVKLRHNWFWLICFFAVLIIGGLGSNSDWFLDESAAHRWELDAIIGEWEPAEGRGESKVAIKAVDVSPRSSDVVRTLSWRYEFTEAFGFKSAEGSWNYESFHPLRLNIVLSGKGYFLAVNFLSDDRVQMRLFDRIEEAIKPDAVQGAPEWTRVR